MFTGLAKFSVLHLLLAAGHGAGGITLSEMDVLWFMPPWAALASATPLTSLLCLDNYCTTRFLSIYLLRVSPAGFGRRAFPNTTRP